MAEFFPGPQKSLVYDDKLFLNVRRGESFEADRAGFPEQRDVREGEAPSELRVFNAMSGRAMLSFFESFRVFRG
jgi:hypothetical protein